MSDQGWFADIDPDHRFGGLARYQPCLQLDGLCLSLDVWFVTEAECITFIRDEIIGKGLL